MFGIRKAFTGLSRLFRNRGEDISPLPPGEYNVRIDSAKIDRHGRLKVDYAVLGTNESGDSFDTNRKIRGTIKPDPES